VPLTSTGTYSVNDDGTGTILLEVTLSDGSIKTATEDYRRVPHYGFIRDTGPFLYQGQTGNFEAKVRIAGKYHVHDEIRTASRPHARFRKLQPGRAAPRAYRSSQLLCVRARQCKMMPSS